MSTFFFKEQQGPLRWCRSRNYSNDCDFEILLAIGHGALPRFEALACSLFSEWDWSFWARLLLAVYDCFVAEVCMLGIPRRFSHFVYGFIQSGLTCAIA